MNYKILQKLPSTEKIIKDSHLTLKDINQVRKHRNEIQDILAGRDKRFILIVGPCSAWPEEAVIKYAEKLKALNDNANVKSQLKIIMRAYTQKPRTKVGWLGPAIQPDPYKEPNIKSGMKYIIKMMLEITKLGLPIASEVLFTHNSKPMLDFLSWACIGARSSEDQEHRIFASAIDCPVGFKNPTHGSLEVCSNSVISSQNSHVTAIDGYEVQTKGNKYSHAVLRGSNKMPNYSDKHIESLKNYMLQHDVKNPAILIDVSHDNCLIKGKKDHKIQPNIVFDILNSLDKKPQLKKYIKGFMLESFLLHGNQKIEINNPDTINLNGLSITDPCLGWKQTEEFVLNLAERLATKTCLETQQAFLATAHG